MIDISEQIKKQICERIRPCLVEVKPFAGKYRRLEDLRVILKRLCPKEHRFDKADGTAWLLKRLFSKEELFVIHDFEDRNTKEVIPVYILPKRNDKDEVGSNERIRMNPYAELNKFALIDDLDLFFDTIARLAKPEVWAYDKSSGRFRYSILESYLNIVIQRLRYEKESLNKKNKIVVCQCCEKDEHGNQKFVEKCVINTGLVSRGRGNFIYIIFNKNNKSGDQEWVLVKNKVKNNDKYLDITDKIHSQSFLPFNGNIPDPVDFEDIIFPNEIHSFNEEHMMVTHCERLPIGFLQHHFKKYFESRKKDPTTPEEWDDFRKYIKALSYNEQEVGYLNAWGALKLSIEKAVRTARVDRNARAEIYRPRKKSIGFFLPLYLEDRKDNMDYDVGVIIDEDENNKGKYVARTIYRTSMAYDRIRAMGYLDCSWLDPKRIKYWINPCPDDDDNSISVNDNKQLKRDD